METDMLVRMSSFPTAPALNQQRRRKVGNKSPTLAKRPCRQQSFSREIGHAAAETYLLTRLSFKLLSYLGVGYRWITRLLALALYAMLLMPGFLQVAFHYFFSSQVRRSVVYGDQPRNRLDLYLPTNIGDLKPVVIFITGGAWIIGYKAWGSLLGLQLAERDIIVACVDYRNFPQGTISDMVADVCQGIAYICNNIIEFGGDPNKIYLMGQSAGAHISACALLRQAVKESRGDNISWSVSQIKAYFGFWRFLLDEFCKCLIPFLNMTECVLSLIATAKGFLVKTFVDALREAGAQADLILYEGKTHTDLFLQDPLRGGKDELFDYLVAFIHADDKEALARDALAPPRRRFVPEILAKLAGQVSPF
ncbi:UNVERIFIED_CONTAM: putative isoprenylcysteine alpha-carbonyl methylesterase ICMEL2 [Sesamum radiatum]|uniref:protein-S-isoprenylcysteine alpha-carbonyl methylesterase n=1 Tax=Sesamum radiatum TaxID=300843 RepID=A0AAW2RCX2_SESRA